MRPLYERNLEEPRVFKRWPGGNLKERLGHVVGRQRHRSWTLQLVAELERLLMARQNRDESQQACFQHQPGTRLFLLPNGLWIEGVHLCIPLESGLYLNPQPLSPKPLTCLKTLGQQSNLASEKDEMRRMAPERSKPSRPCYPLVILVSCNANKGLRT